MTQVVEALHAALDGERPGRIGSIKNQLLLINRRKNAPTEQLLTELMAAIAEVTEAVGNEGDGAVVLSIRDGELEISAPPLELGPGDDQGDLRTLRAELDAAAAATNARAVIAHEPESSTS